MEEIEIPVTQSPNLRNTLITMVIATAVGAIVSKLTEKAVSSFMENRDSSVTTDS